MKSLNRFLRKFGPLFLAVLGSGWLCYQMGFRDGYNTAAEEVAVATQRLLMENCLSFNTDLARMGKSERMDCSLFGELNPSVTL